MASLTSLRVWAEPVDTEKDRKVFLDGVRGWAALMVVFYHVLHCFPVAALQPDQSRWLHFISDGPLAVYIFFVLSGFALSTAFFETGNRRVVVAAALRRYPRLTIPVFASCLIAFTLLSTGLMFNQPAGLAAGSGDWLSIHYAFTPQISDLLSYSLAIVYWDGDAPISYNAVLWTMPLEMFGSLLVFAILYLFGLATVRLIVYAVTLAVLVADNSHLVTFILGMMLADAYRFAWLQRIRHAGSGLWIGMGFAGAGFLLATGSAGLITAPYAMSLVAACFVLAVVSSRRLAGLFESPMSRFLGRISFPLYLIHLVFLCSASSWAYLTLAGWGFAATPCAALTQIFTIIGALVAATLFEPIERFSVSASRMFAQAVMTRWPESGLRSR
jgi:peptidoglycan/LPS O-acetylase OafA/YrhL